MNNDIEMCPKCREDCVYHGGTLCDHCQERVCEYCYKHSEHMCWTCVLGISDRWKNYKCSKCDETDPREMWEYACVVCQQWMCDTCFEDKGNPAFDACEDCIRQLINEAVTQRKPPMEMESAATE